MKPACSLHHLECISSLHISSSSCSTVYLDILGLVLKTLHAVTRLSAVNYCISSLHISSSSCSTVYLDILGLVLKTLHAVTRLSAVNYWVDRSGRATSSSPTNLTSTRLCRTSTSAYPSGGGTGRCVLTIIRIIKRT